MSAARLKGRRMREGQQQKEKNERKREKQQQQTQIVASERQHAQQLDTNMIICKTTLINTRFQVSRPSS
jgi:hypothetical protein